MSTKAELIKEMMEMQKKFISHEHEHGVDPQEYFAPEPGSDLDGYRQKYRDIAMKVVDMAHEEVGSVR
ncbi:MAG: hypothetical protein OEZ38_11975 [Gammaproteobacteria bacterium]|nr:hypothetical protein [Gammaproteobacteria bacterium]